MSIFEFDIFINPKIEPQTSSEIKGNKTNIIYVSSSVFKSVAQNKLKDSNAFFSLLYSKHAAVETVYTAQYNVCLCRCGCYRKGLLCIRYGQVEAAFSSQAFKCAVRHPHLNGNLT